MKNFHALMLYVVLCTVVSLVFRVAMTLIGWESYDTGEIIARSLFWGVFMGTSFFLVERWTMSKHK